MKKYIEVLIVDTNGVDEKVMFLGDLHEFLTKFENSKVIALQKDNDTVYWTTTNIVGFQIIKEGEINDRNTFI